MFETTNSFKSSTIRLLGGSTLTPFGGFTVRFFGVFFVVPETRTTCRRSNAFDNASNVIFVCTLPFAHTCPHAHGLNIYKWTSQTPMEQHETLRLQGQRLFNCNLIIHGRKYVICNHSCCRCTAFEVRTRDPCMANHSFA